jgi:2-polyprenyl-3-methyl-5-hydroxy-6-metoxy-1,4-benzoquinol methylase
MLSIFDLYAERVLPYVNVGIRMRDTSLDLWLSSMMHRFGDVRDKAIIDFGSGSGHKAILLALCGAHVTAVEIDPAKVEYIRSSSRKAGVAINFVTGGVQTLAEFPADTFDHILLSEVFKHLPLYYSHNFSSLNKEFDLNTRAPE